MIDIDKEMDDLKLARRLLEEVWRSIDDVDELPLSAEEKTDAIKGHWFAHRLLGPHDQYAVVRQMGKALVTLLLNEMEPCDERRVAIAAVDKAIRAAGGHFRDRDFKQYEESGHS